MIRISGDAGALKQKIQNVHWNMEEDSYVACNPHEHGERTTDVYNKQTSTFSYDICSKEKLCLVGNSDTRVVHLAAFYKMQDEIFKSWKDKQLFLLFASWKF